MQTNNVQAGEIACQYIVEKLGGKGNVIIQNGPQVSAVIDRVNGCKAVLKKSPDIKVLSDDQDAKGSREGGLNVMQNHLTRFPKVDAVFAINDPQAIGADLAARQLNRKNIVITSVDGAPDIETALKGDTQVQASASQDPYMIAQKAVEIGHDILNGKKPAEQMTLLPSTLITRDQRQGLQGLAGPPLTRRTAMFVVCGEALMDVYMGEADAHRHDARCAHRRLAAQRGAGAGAAARPVAFLAGLSTDACGERLLASLRAEGVDTSLVLRSDAPSTLSVVSVDASGVPRYAFHGNGAADRQITHDTLPALPPPRACCSSAPMRSRSSRWEAPCAPWPHASASGG